MPKRARTLQTQELVQKCLVKMIVVDELPFYIVEQDGFKQLMEAKFPGFYIPSCEKIYKDCAQLFKDEKLKLKSFTKRTNPRVCLTLDTWTSNQSMNYLCITAHFIDDNWNLHKKVIGFSPISSDNGEEIGRVVEKCLLDWEIDNVLTMSTGNASSYDAAVGYLRTRLANTVSNGKFLHLKCLVDFINNMVKEVLKESDKSVTRVREAVRYVTQSATTIEKFKECAREYGITITSRFTSSLDCPSRWNSTFEMLQMSETFEGVFNRFKVKDSTYKRELQVTCGVPDHSDWEKIRKVLTVLNGLHQSTESILQWHVQSNMFLLELANLEQHLDNSGAMVCGWGFGFDTNAINVALEMKWKYNEYWGDVENSNVLIYVANILDPRRKVELIEFYFRKYYKHDYTDEGICMWKKKAEWVVSATYDLFNEYIGKTGTSQQRANFQTSGYMHYLYDDTRNVGFGDNVRNKTEIDIYLNELCDRDSDFFGFDVLLWWKNNSERFPVLSKMAKDVLAIPISAVALESAFNISGCLLDDFQSSLSPSMAEALVCTQDWLRESKKQVKMNEDSPNLDKLVKDIYEQVEGASSG
ncbi:putative HAT dimerization domain, ribonuclease H-like superfamily, hAT-like transposase, RNase-H [Helianthus annuus]|uniref:zinc finger BED domain-containing protein DAYSLEEPER-like n=1 Tax=Helianthus annuus TaxID=4232 RepID=UPI000B903D10|nr:zinc finger BED domain-containing protein DAYSLEEPER-like [Helianthus annuus]KAJ0442740.1 putative HAT dimerization domain, ribonuclease H-like superfamily, hAT-like transposase, RNase-H [Helianthus annuus]